MTIRRVLATLAVLALVSACARAGPPYVTDDPETPALHGWEINVPYARTTTSGVTQTEVPLFDINYGLRENLQMKVEVPVAGISGIGTGNGKGWGDTLIGPKWRFFDETKRRPQVAVYPQILIPTGNAARGLGAGKSAYYLPVLVEKNWGNWTSFGNVGYVIQNAGGARDYWYYGAALTKEVNRRLIFGAELFGNSPLDNSSRSLLGYSLGLEWKIAPHSNLLVSAGHDLRGDPTRLLYLGLQFEIESRRHHRERAARHPRDVVTNP